MSDKIRIVSLGGLDEEGKNCTVVDINGDLFVVGCGVREPDKTMPGVDYVIPQFDYLKENKDRLKAYILLHGHDDEIGALAYVYPEVKAPVYGSAVTLAMLKIFTRHVDRDPNMYDLRPVLATSTFKIAGRTFHFFHTAHNVADSSGLCIETDLGNIVFTGDYVVENTASPLFLNDMNALAAISEKPTLTLLSESMYAEKSGYTAPLYRLTPHIEESFKSAPGRIFVSLYGSNLFNFDELKNLAVKYKKKIICYDEASLSVLESVQDNGALMIPKENYATIDQILRLRDQDIVVLLFGYGARLFRKIALLGSGSNEDKRVQLKPTDTFIIASPSDDNTEVEYSDAADTLYRTGCHVINVPRKSFLKMHASEEDLKMMASILKPKFYIPVKGFYKDLLRNAKNALSMGINLGHQNVFVVENGYSILLDEKGGRVMDEKIPHGDLLIDGAGVGDISKSVLEERQKLADGVAVLALTVSRSKRKIVAGPDVQMRGFVFVKDADATIREVSKVFVSTVNEFLSKGGDCNFDEIRQNVYEKCLKAIRRQTGKDPMVIPAIVEIP